MQPAAKITGVPFNKDLLDYLAKDIIDNHNSIYIANKVVVVLPSRRAVRNLKSKLLHLTEDKICFLPQIITYSDIASNLILFNSCCNDLDTRMPEVIDSFSLELVILETIEEIKTNFPDFKTFQDKKISSYIKKFFIKYFTYNQHPPYPKVDNPDYKVINYLLESFQSKLRTLKKVTEQQLRNIAIQKLQHAWTANNDEVSIYAVLPPSNIPYIFNFLKLVARKKNAEIFIHGLSEPPSANEWESITEKHPYFFIKKFLSYIDIPATQITYLPNAESHSNSFNYIETTNEVEEAKQISLTVIDHLNSNYKRIGIITENRTLAKLIKASLKRYNIEVNDTTAKTLLDLNKFKFFLLTFEFAITSNLDKVMLLGFLKNPSINLNKKEIESFEIAYLRNSQVYKHLSELLEKIEIKEEYNNITRILKTILFFKSSILQSTNFYKLFSQHLKLFNAVIGEQNEAIQHGIEYLTNLKLMLKPLSYAHKPIKIRQYKELLLKILSEQNYRDEEYIEEVQILTALEARLQSFDLAIIPSLNEGEFPNITRDWPLIDASLATHFKFPNYQEPLGLGAYDFNNLINNAEVILSRSLHSMGRETIESRFLSQLKISSKLKAITYKSAENLKTIEYKPLPRPNPKPPLAARPKKFSVSALERLIFNPYVYYAKYILNLTPLPELNETFVRKDFGIYLHKALSIVFEQKLPNDIEEFKKALLAQFITATKEGSSVEPSTMRFWLKRVERIAPWIYDYEKTNSVNLKESFTEKRKEIVLSINNQDITISAIFDRIITYDDNSIKIIDYKTGYTPLQKEVDQGLAPQFPIENLILSSTTGSHTITQEYIELKGKKDIANVKEVEVNSETTKSEIIRLLSMFMDSNQGYFASTDLEKNKRFREYHHLISLNLE